MLQSISTQTLQRLPAYLRYLESLPRNGAMNISAKIIAGALGLGEIQVRKDLAAVSSGGRPGIGYITEELIADIQSFLGNDNVSDAVLVGAGRLGRALLAYDGFREQGLNIVAAFDASDRVVAEHGKDGRVFPINKLKDLCGRLQIRVGIVAVPSDGAQTACDMLLDAGVLAIWNFAPVHLKVPDNILVKNENLAATFAVLCRRLAKAGQEGTTK